MQEKKGEREDRNNGCAMSEGKNIKKTNTN
jgi:hypothetical protein